MPHPGSAAFLQKCVKNIYLLSLFLDYFFCSVTLIFQHFYWGAGNTSGFGMQLCFSVRIGQYYGIVRNFLEELGQWPICPKRSGGVKTQQLWLLSVVGERLSRPEGRGANLNFSRPTVDPPSRQLPPPKPLSKSFIFFTSIFLYFSFKLSHFHTFSLSFSHFHTSNLSKLHFHTFASFSFHLTRPQTSFIFSISPKPKQQGYG